jgi:hypothetical protein
VKTTRRRAQCYSIFSDEDYGEVKRLLLTSRVKHNDLKEQESRKRMELMDVQV